MTDRRIQASVRSDDDAVERDVLREALRDAMAHWASGVTVVAVADGPMIHAVTVTAFLSVSLDPPLVLVSLGGNATVLPVLSPGTAFGISILSNAQRRIASMFTDPAPIGREVFEREDVPLVKDALVSLTCVVEERVFAGDHTLVVAGVQRVRETATGSPLIRYARSWTTVRDR